MFPNQPKHTEIYRCSFGVSYILFVSHLPLSTVLLSVRTTLRLAATAVALVDVPPRRGSPGQFCYCGRHRHYCVRHLFDHIRWLCYLKLELGRQEKADPCLLPRGRWRLWSMTYCNSILFTSRMGDDKSHERTGRETATAGYTDGAVGATTLRALESPGKRDTRFTIVNVTV